MKNNVVESMENTFLFLLINLASQTSEVYQDSITWMSVLMVVLRILGHVDPWTENKECNLLE